MGNNKFKVLEIIFYRELHINLNFKSNIINILWKDNNIKRILEKQQNRKIMTK